ncbi:hypothetical protein M430DRAFT_37696 [Amorphotheca resinae ATCC 22711]|jgi:hypothetical protein|uniref:Uncharacterized protein n=1 Tax=Amorphotheca resinae ATCC 22711 TaxID=857342 RepID=A0A2T3AQ22_AMORE|nr:hypothetical protein M430DRAFT_37696 [Amorphotheca resinae ATCC 22711]PSS07106.1 hypothetical protein M430DRAFT_37696 [Amorphotheca resinae ATCC 22711]
MVWMYLGCTPRWVSGVMEGRRDDTIGDNSYTQTLLVFDVVVQEEAAKTLIDRAESSKAKRSKAKQSKAKQSKAKEGKDEAGQIRTKQTRPSVLYLNLHPSPLSARTSRGRLQVSRRMIAVIL